MKQWLRDLHTLYIATVCNPFSDMHSAIQNPTFEQNIHKLVKNWYRLQREHTSSSTDAWAATAARRAQGTSLAIRSVQRAPFAHSSSLRNYVCALSLLAGSTWSENNCSGIRFCLRWRWLLAARASLARAAAACCHNLASALHCSIPRPCMRVALVGIIVSHPCTSCHVHSATTLLFVNF